MLAMDSVVQNLGQKYLKTYAQYMSVSRKDMLNKQEDNFNSLRRSLRGTRLYRDLRLSHIHTYEEFVNHVPVYGYDEYAPYIDMVAAGHQDILFKDDVAHFGLSSGTSGKDSKRVPYNEKMIRMFLKSQKRIASKLSALEPDINFLKVGRLTFGSDPYLYSQNGFKFGYISGILSTRVPKSLAKNTFPSKEVLAISNWDKKIDVLIQESLHQDIQVVSGIPTYIISIFEAILQKTGKKHINEIWPNLKVFVYAATPIKQYKERIDRLVGHELNYYGVYAATEGAIGLPYEKYNEGQQRYILNPDLLYSFTPVEGEKRNLGLHEIKMNTPYSINIGTPNGLIHYAMKDVVVFTEYQGDLVFEFVGRKSTGMNLAAEKVSDDEILDCYLATKNATNVDLRHFFLSPINHDGKVSYLWTLFIPTHSEVDKELLAQTLDKEMQRLNGDYQDCREIEVLGRAQVTLMSADYLQAYFEKNRSRGQFKMKTTFETAEEYLKFISAHIAAPEVVQ
ncbi:GH3 auxin-responsive promoter family protein [Bdellovibrio sp. 22V]|uniref:GH3 family domain-containing protein n=1 Tax=Bdellovibrio TaxID=958 RepID=UPI002543CA7C|nr:GH3 auxin-responsive promoter family protein [Bdellovibrio sp. 22V]WII71018.1 GH3 auxin-responsive promoter family protein [Bdellovibrio sp. 22V]